jgi:ribonuclease R
MNIELKEYEGQVSINKDNDGYVKIPELDFATVYVANKDLNTALQGDRVKIKVTGENEYGPVGVINEVLLRSKKAHAGVLRKGENEYYLEPHDPKTYVNILINHDAIQNANVGDKVAVEIVEWKDSLAAQGIVIKNLGKPGENNAEMLAYALERGFSDEHKNEVKKEAEAISERGITDEDLKGRRDFTSVLTFTIDPFDAKDFDDAISYLKLPNGNVEVGIHIADVSHYVTPGSHLDEEAVERETSVYLVDRCIPMLPEVLSNDLCSLVEGKIRLVMSAVFELNDKGEVQNEWYGKAFIKSAKRFTYENAQESMSSNGIHSAELNHLNSIAKSLNEERFRSGALSLDSEEVKFVLDENGVPVDVYIKHRGDTNKMIEELMLLANRKVSEFITKKQTIPKPICIYRIHDKPDAERMHDLNLFIKGLGQHVRFIDGAIPSQDLNALLIKMEGRPEKDLLQVNIARSMAKAIYS